MGLLLDFCRLGGTVEERFWVPIGNSDYSSIVYSIPQSVDAIYVALGGSDAVNFLKQYQQAGGSKPMIGGSITVDQSILSAKGLSADYLVGTPSAGPIADNWQNDDWQAFVERYQEKYPDGFSSPSLFAHGYYVNTLAALTALEEVDGELGDHERFREVASNLELDTPTGTVSVDQNRQARADIFVTQVAQRDDGTLYNEVVKVVEDVSQTLGRDRDDFMQLGQPSRTNPECN
jgi:branched-chain amino acid transport system substrate-binding protein